MVTSRKNAEPSRPRRPPATTPESAENRLVSLAVDLAEKQLIEGTASSQVITHYLKLATVEAKLQHRKLEQETKLLEARVENMASAKRVEELYGQALNAMRRYQGQDVEPEFDDYAN